MEDINPFRHADTIIQISHTVYIHVILSIQEILFLSVNCLVAEKIGVFSKYEQ